MKFVMIYETDLEKLPLARLHFPDHRARLEEFRARGTLPMSGPLANPADGAIGIFTEKEAAEEFIAGGPFVTNGVVKKFSVLQWSEVLA
ncbi:MAG TPA: YciI family protein [Opitutaceae bacterium]